ncbi:hypothetical protein ACFFWB_24460 [Flavobacterium procerum]|uniref:hypothetical protein n=1 Tax=Flavobacterium procerum TaxID=1455569 RepID=UPI0035ED2AE4
MTDDESSTENTIIVALEQLVLKDNSLNQVFDLEYGEEAERKYIGSEWIRKNTECNDEE